MAACPINPTVCARQIHPESMYANGSFVVSLAAAALALAGCADSPSAGGDGGAPGQAGNVGSSGAMTSGTGPNPSGGSQVTGGSSASAGSVAVGGSASAGGQMATAGSNAEGGGGSGGSGGSGGGNAGTGGAAGMGGGAGGAAIGPCSPARPHAAGNSTVTLQSSGMNRSYLLHIPPGYDGTKPLPLVFDVHGYTSFASEQLMRSKWDKMADTEGFVLIDPEGVNKSWNAGSCCGGNNQDDVKYFRDVVAKATTELCIDKKRVYVSGHSNGGAMTHRLACEAADIFAAAAPVCGWMTISNCNPVRPVPMLSIRGLNDGTVKIDGADADVNEWLSNDQCAKDQVTTSGVCKTYKSCAAGTQVMDCRPRGDHNFFYANNPDNYLVPDNAWPFFKQFSLP
jgi:polyhydroxybutyrate depolymerase